MEDLQGGTLALEHRYDILERRDRHGAITVYHGRQDPFSQPVWVQVYSGLVEAHAVDSGGDRLVDRLKESARVASAFQSPGVLRVVDYGELEGRVPFVISERSPHDSLAALLGREGTISTRLTCEIIEQIAEILAPIHRERLAHGALSPRWIYLDTRDIKTLSVGHFQMDLTPVEIEQVDPTALSPALIAPFGPEFYAHDSDDLDAPEDPTASDDTYAPRRDRGAGAMSPAGDVWALGVIAYSALVGMHPFMDPDRPAHEAIEALQTQAPRPLDELGVDAEVSDVIMRALSKDPRARFLNAPDFASALWAASGQQREAGKGPAVESGPAVAPAAPLAQAPEVDNHQTSTTRAAEVVPREPGPSDRLLSVALMLLILSNLAWLFYVVAN